MSDQEIHRICLFGGTFDPPHLGHLVLAEQALHSYNFEKIVFLPSGDPPLRQGTSAAAQDRLKMLEMATADNDLFEVDGREIERLGTSYTWITIEEMLFEQPNTELFFIVGADQVARFDQWERIEWLLEVVNFIPAFRPPYGAEIFEDLRTRLNPDKILEIADRTIEMPQMMVSSTELRWWVSQGRSIRYLVPNDVRDYIIEKELYKEMNLDPLAFFGE